MKQSALGFRQASIKALQDEQLQSALAKAKDGFVEKRRVAIEALPEFEQIKRQAVAIKNHALDHLGDYLIEFEQVVIKSGGHVHWAQSSEDATRIIVDICKAVNAKSISKGKSMISEEIELNDALQAAGYEVIETDLGEYIIQLAKEPPSHIIAPAVHKTKAQIEQLFDHFHGQNLPSGRSREALVAEARVKLREAFLKADVGITGANFLIAETGSTVLVTNEGNGDLTASIPKVHIVTASIDKIIPKLDDLPTFLRLLGRSATGQELTAYTSLFTGPRRNTDESGPEQFHIILLDNGRSDMLNGPFKEALRCIRCGACLNHCAVYGAVGGHAYEAVYPGPIGQVMMPLLSDLDPSLEAISACTMNGHCQQVCPMAIPLPDLIRQHRVNAFEQRRTSIQERIALGAWKALARRPKWYRSFNLLAAKALQFLGKYPRLQKLITPLANWRKGRALMLAHGQTFQQQQLNRTSHE